MKKGRVFLILMITTIFVISTIGTASAWQSISGISDKTAVVITWRLNNGRWKACGPIQMTSLSKQDEDTAIDYVRHQGREILMYAGTVVVKGHYGNVYHLGRDLRGGEFDARKCIK